MKMPEQRGVLFSVRSWFKVRSPANLRSAQEFIIDTTAVETSAICRNCSASLTAGWRYCAACGQNACTPRLTMHEIVYESLHALLHVDRSVLSLLRALAQRPGSVALEYVSGRRRRYYGPFAFLVISVAVGSAAVALSGFAVTANGTSAVAEFLQRHVNLIFFFQVPVIAAVCRLLTPRGPFNYGEYLVLAAYTSAIHTLFFMVVDVGGWYVLRPSATIAKVAYFVLLPTWPLYFAWACTQFLPGSKWIAAGKGLIACVVTYAVMQRTAAGVGALPQLLGN